MATRPLAGVLLLLLLHTSYPAPAHAQATPSSRFPGAQWEVRTPEEVGMSNQRLEEALEYARGPTNTRSHCVSVHRRGFLVAEGYWNGRDPSSTDIVWSTAKAVAATLVGIAEQDGLLSTESLASAHIPEWQDTPSEGITVDMLLRHDSGRYYDLISDFVVPQLTGLNGSGLPPTQTDYAVRQEGCLLGPCQAHPPGTVYQYNQMAFQALEPVLRLATGLSLNELSRTRLHSALGFESEVD
jgi:CubicO group peptidase (beta-lactamase class C family)